jgi:hypothetical protein
MRESDLDAAMFEAIWADATGRTARAMTEELPLVGVFDVTGEPGNYVIECGWCGTTSTGLVDEFIRSHRCPRAARNLAADLRRAEEMRKRPEVVE